MTNARQGNMFPQELWNTTYSNRPVSLAGDNHAIVHLLRAHLPSGPGHALELGCCPGTFLGHLGLMGYTMHGIDLSPSVHGVGAAFQAAGLPCGDFLEQDFFEFCAAPPRRYDVVTSYGFVEHFENFEKVFFLHCRLVEEGGYLVVTFPNFAGKLQYALHALLDKANLDRHNVASMQVEPYVKMASALGFEVLFAGFFGGFSFWREECEPMPDDPVLHSLLAGVEDVKRSGALQGDSASWSCYGGIVARKVANTPR